MYFCLFFHSTATTQIYTLSLHDALPILAGFAVLNYSTAAVHVMLPGDRALLDKYLRALPVMSAYEILPLLFTPLLPDRKSTRLNSSHMSISYAVFCLKKKQPRPRVCLQS